MPNAIRSFFRGFNAGCLSSYPSCPPYCASTSLSGVIGPWRGGSSPAVTYMQRAQSSPFTLRACSKGERFASDSKRCLSAIPPLLPYAVSTLFRRYLPVARGLVPRFCALVFVGSLWLHWLLALRHFQSALRTYFDPSTSSGQAGSARTESRAQLIEFSLPTVRPELVEG